MMAVRRIQLSDETIQKLDRIADAPTIDGDLFREIGLTLGEAVRFAQDTDNVPSARDVRNLIRMTGPAPELDELLVLAKRREELDRKESQGVVSQVLLIVANAAALIAGYWVFRALSKRPRRERRATALSEESSMIGQDRPAAIEEESAPGA